MSWHEDSYMMLLHALEVRVYTVHVRIYEFAWTMILFIRISSPNHKPREELVLERGLIISDCCVFELVLIIYFTVIRDHNRNYATLLVLVL